MVFEGVKSVDNIVRTNSWTGKIVVLLSMKVIFHPSVHFLLNSQTLIGLTLKHHGQNLIFGQLEITAF